MSEHETTQTMEDARQQLAALERRIQVEDALERVRARTMAMHESDELAETAVVLFEQLEGLGLDMYWCWCCLFDEAVEVLEVWLTAPGGNINPISYRLSLTENPHVQKGYELWKKGISYFVKTWEGEEAAAWRAYLYELTGLPGYSETSAPKHFVDVEACFAYGMLGVTTYALPDEETIQTLRRFAKVFEMTYRRFLDLQQAEERAREAIRQASLDRVRAEIASMRTADDLQRITPLVWRELTTLGVPFFRCGVFIIDEGSEDVEMFLSNNEGKQLAALRLSFGSHALIQDAVVAWRNRRVVTDQWDQERLVAWIDFLTARGDITKPDDYMDREDPLPSLALHLVPFAQGLLYVGSAAPLAADQVDLVQTLADAFAVAYARYEDFTQLEVAKADVEAALDHLKTTQRQLIQSEKMASLGALTAGIAHEIKNPLNFVNNFAEVNVELADELREAYEADPDIKLADLLDVLDDLKQIAGVIAQHGKRADGIVHAMMQHASGGTGQREATDINHLVSEHINLAHHGKRAQLPDLTVDIKRDLDPGVDRVSVVPQEIGRVLLNLLGNAFDAVHEYAARVKGAYEPTVTVSTRQVDGRVEIRVADNGPGIPLKIREKIFEPFFTTKPAGEGTGLGLSLSYEIVTQGHGGTLTVESEAGQGATFVVTLPAGAGTSQ